MVEFALIGPVAFLLLLGVIVLGVIVLHEIQLTQAVRDSARAAAICGSNTSPTNVFSTLPDSNLPCTGANIVAYINARVAKVDPSLSNQATVTVYDSTGASVSTATGASAGTVVSNCSPNAYTVEVSITYAQPLYLPLVSNVFGTSGGNTRTISAKGEATCER